RLARGQPRDRRPARPHALRGARHHRRALMGARADERAAALRSVRERTRRGIHDRVRGRAASRLRRLPAGRRRADGLRRPAGARGGGVPGRDPRRRAARPRVGGDARRRSRARGDRAIRGERRLGAGAMSVRVANAPLSYGAFEMTVGSAFPVPDPEQVLAAIGDAGYAGTDLGPPGYYGEGPVLAERLDANELEVVGGFVPMRFSEREHWEQGLAGLRHTLDLFDAAGAAAARPVLC